MASVAAGDVADTIARLDPCAAPAAEPEPVDPGDDILVVDDDTTLYVFLPLRAACDTRALVARFGSTV
ncbi:hypothetical protein [Embleya sp. NPDC020886]|uniref:hypothetical protein n=1 Tax=Embleya sp. NPDC020886 TaxID=3363980 RepID=UPI0037A2D448